MRRRILASLLQILISAQMVTPLVAAGTRSDLPACCRRAGKHHCAESTVRHIAQPSGPSDQSGQAQISEQRCALFPHDVIPGSGLKVIGIPGQGQSPSVVVASPVCAAPVTECAPAHSGDSAPKRGPPVRL